MTKYKLIKFLMTVVLVIGVLVVGALFWWVKILFDPHEDKQSSSMTLESDKSRYHVGDEIVLTLKPDWDRPLNKEVRKSFSFWVYDYGSGLELLSVRAETFSEDDPTIRDEDFELWREKRPLDIKGRISAKGKEVSVTFDGFGTFQLSPPASLKLSFWYSPLRPDPLNSLEDYSNEIAIEVVK
jgi:hypothetical protein